MLKISVETIPHSCQRYDTVGDWTFEPDGTLNVNVSKILKRDEEMSQQLKAIVGEHCTGAFQELEDFEFLVAIHEIIEAWLCKKDGITAEQVDEWDKGLSDESLYEEPGEDPRAPYHIQHLIATSIEVMLCAQLKLNWAEYDQHVKNVT